MIKTIIKIGKDKKIFFLPENWLEIKLKHLINLELWQGDSSDPVGLLACFLQIDPDIIGNSKKDYWTELLTLLNFVFNAPKWHNLKIPDTVFLDNRSIKVPKRLEMERFGQKVVCLQYMASMKQDNIALIPDVMAVYFQPLIDGKFNRNRIEYVKRLIMDMPAIEAVPIGRFFFRKLLKSKTLGRLGLRRSRLIRSVKLNSAQPAAVS